MLSEPRPLDSPCDARLAAASASALAASLAEPDAYRLAASTFSALSDPTRLAILHALALRELCTCDIAAICRASESRVSQHLRILRAERLLRTRRSGKFVFHALADDHVRNLVSLALAHRGHLDGCTAAVPA